MVDDYVKLWLRDFEILGYAVCCDVDDIYTGRLILNTERSLYRLDIGGADQHSRERIDRHLSDVLRGYSQADFDIIVTVQRYCGKIILNQDRLAAGMGDKVQVFARVEFIGSLDTVSCFIVKETNCIRIVFQSST